MRAPGYAARRYWRDRHRAYGFDLRGVGNRSLDHEENAAEYREAGRVFLDLCREADIPFGDARVLDIGCGVGFYAGILREQGVTDYRGVDIVDELFGELRERYPGFRFDVHDITATPLDDTYDLVLMIDVTQHITVPEKFTAAMEHVRRALRPGGHFVVTSWLQDEETSSFYEVRRTMEPYRNAFAGAELVAPRPFRDKYLFAFREPAAPDQSR